jgi:hypothetical protein
MLSSCRTPLKSREPVGHGRMGVSSPERQRDGKQRRSGGAAALHGGGEAPVSSSARRWLLQHEKGCRR